MINMWLDMTFKSSLAKILFNPVKYSFLFDWNQFSTHFRNLANAKPSHPTYGHFGLLFVGRSYQTGPKWYDEFDNFITISQKNSH
jgi:hypothetical protein